jgi:hypothetical protein
VEIRSADVDGQRRRSLAVALVVVATPRDGGGKDEQQRTLNT